jgi:sugar transferase (PEP-CTERM system associated)
VLGTGPQAQELATEIRERGDTGLEVVGLLGQGSGAPAIDGDGAPRLGDVDALVELTRQHRVSRVVVALEDRRGQFPVADLLRCRMAGILIEERESLYEKIHGKIAVESLRPSYLIFSPGFSKARLALASKRVLDIVAASVGLLVSLPIQLLAAIAIRIDSRGPILLRQPRVGQDGVPFIVYKFRSLRVDAEGSGPVWAKPNDSRITRVGKVIRALRIDEIPQMWNVLKGEMSFVGPRPERPFFVQELIREIPYYSQRLTVKPGITGWAQICYPYGSSTRDALEKLQYDLYYIKNMSILFDLTIIAKTIRVVLFRQGAR